MAVERLRVAFDTETGDLSPVTGDILTLYMAVISVDDKILDEVDLKIKPDNDRLPMAVASALKINKIDLKAHLEDPSTITYSEAKEKIVSMLKRHHKKVGKYNNLAAFGQNVNFDIKFVQHYMIPESEWNSLFHYKTIDTGQRIDFLKEAEYLPPDVGTLESTANFLEIDTGTAHTAKDDTITCIKVNRKILDILKSKKDGGSSQDLISLLESD